MCAIRTKFNWPKKIHGFTLVELIVVITILAILATVGFLSLSGYSDDARSSVAKANVRMVYSAIATESATTGNSPRYYVSHDPAAALSGTVTVGGVSVTLSGGDWNFPGTNYSAGNPRWDLLRLNPDKFRISAGFRALAEPALAAYDSGSVTVGAVDVPGQPTLGGRKRVVPAFQVAAVSKTKSVATMGNYAPASGTDLQGLMKDPSGSSSSIALVDSSAPPVTWSTYSVSGTFGSGGSGAVVSVCGSNVTADSTGYFIRNSIPTGAACNNVSATVAKPGFTCSVTVNGPSFLSSNVSNVSGSCALTRQLCTLSDGSNGIQNYDVATSTWGPCLAATTSTMFANPMQGWRTIMEYANSTTRLNWCKDNGYLGFSTSTTWSYHGDQSCYLGYWTYTTSAGGWYEITSLTCIK